MSGYKVDWSRVAKLKAQGLTATMIAERVGCSASNIKKILIRSEEKRLQIVTS